MIPYGRQDITEDDFDAVFAVLKSDFITQGPAITDFETAFAKKCNVQSWFSSKNTKKDY